MTDEVYPCPYVECEEEPADERELENHIGCVHGEQALFGHRLIRAIGRSQDSERDRDD